MGGVLRRCASIRNGLGRELRLSAGRACGLIGAGLLFSPQAQAQTAPAPPRAPTREEVRLTPPRPADRGAAQLTVEGGIEHSPCALADPAYGDIHFTLSDVRFENLRGLPPEALRPAWASYAGTRQPLAAICEIRDHAAAILRDAGYIAAIEIPEQRIADGVVRFDVLMARLVAVRVRGDAGRSERIVSRTLTPLTRQEVFNRNDAERYLLLAGDLPGFDVRLALKTAGGAPGEVIGEVTVKRIPGQVDFVAQNYGSSELGPLGGLIRAQLYSLTGLGDRTSLAFFTTADFEEQQTVQVAHDFRVGGDGLTLGGELTYAWANPSLGLAGVDVTARTMLATVQASYPFIRSQRRNVSGTAGLDMIDQRVRFNGLPLSRDRLRVGFVRLEAEASDPASIARLGGYSEAEPRWRLGATIEARQGLDILGASEGCGPALVRCSAPGAVAPSRLEADPTATVFRLEARAEIRPVPKITLALGLRAQHSGQALATFEEYSAGNYTVGRGYDAGTLLGDSGLGFQGELRFGSLVPRSPRAVALQAYLFFDAARVSNRDRLLAIPGTAHLASAGGGVRAALGDSARLDAALAVPLERAGLQSRSGHPRLLVSLTTRLWPWSFK